MKNFNFKKKYGQNFLVDQNILNKIVSDIEVKTNSLVIEIGCGDGKLTKYLCDNFDYVLGYEVDLDLKEKLYNNLKNYSNYNIIFDDFLKRNLDEDINNKYDYIYIIANLPYYITTPIVEKITKSNLPFEIMRIMVQKEVGDRFCAEIGTKNYNSLSVYLNYNYIVKKNFVVSRNCFYPKPNVDSLIVSFYKRKNKIFIKNLEIFDKLLRDSFKFKRKTLRNNLKEYDLKIILDVLKKYNLDLSVRAEQLSTEIFCEISNKISI